MPSRIIAVIMRECAVDLGLCPLSSYLCCLQCVMTLQHSKELSLTYLHSLHTVQTKVKRQAVEEFPLAIVLLLFGQNKHNDNMDSIPPTAHDKVRRNVLKTAV